jgi:hypothetical protein
MLIKNNLEKPPTYHIDNLRSNKITWNEKRIARLVYAVKKNIN